MKLIRAIDELKKGDSIIVKDCPQFEEQGFARISGDIFEITNGSSSFTIKCKETNALEKVSLDFGKIFLID